MSQDQVPRMNPPASESFVVVDVETATSDRASICQIGLVRVVDGMCVDRWSSLVNPGVPFHEVNISIHGITSVAVQDAPRFSALVPELRQRFAGEVVGCHTMFDRDAFDAACDLHGESPFDVRWLDTAEVVRRTWTQFARKGYKLNNIAAYLGLTFQHHDALEDAHVTAQVLLRAVEKTGVRVEEWYARTQ